MNDTLIIGQSQQVPTPLDISGNINRLADVAAQSADWGVQLLVLPEMCMTGYNITPKELQQVAEERDGALFGEIAALCQQHKLAIVYGYAEKTHTGAFFNSVQLIDSNGNSLLHYRKTHLWGDLDRNLFQAGDMLSDVVTLNGWAVGVAICYDIEFPETVRYLALKGAELVAVPTGLMAPWRMVAEQVIPIRAYENKLFMAYTNYCGTERDITYEGRSCIADPNGLILAAASSEQPALLTATLERDVLRKARSDLPYLNDRRPELYGNLL